MRIGKKLTTSSKSLKLHVRMFIFLHSFVVLWLWHTFTFSGLLLFYLAHAFLKWVLTWKFLPKRLTVPAYAAINKIYNKIALNSTKQERTINRVSLIDLAIKNMLFKRSRAFITVGGMAIGIGAIVFLVSIGFGLQELVVSRVARLDELKQADVSSQPGSKEVITDQTIAMFEDFNGVDKVLPLIAIVARVEFQNSATDMPVYGVTSQFLEQSAIKTIQGKLFDSNEVASTNPAGKVAGVATTAVTQFVGTPNSQPSSKTEIPIEFSIDEKSFVKIRTQPTKKSTVLGYARREVGPQQGYKVWGEMYPESKSEGLIEDAKAYGAWVRADYQLWKLAPCSVENSNCVDGKYVPDVDEGGVQKSITGYTSLINVTILTQLEPAPIEGSVLGDSTDEYGEALIPLADTSDTEVLAAADPTDALQLADSDEGWVEIASESAFAATEQITKVSLGSAAKRQAVVNIAMLKILGLSENDAIGKTFKSSFVVVGDLLNKPGEKVESVPENYEIVGVIPEDKTPYFYVPFVDLRLLGINQYSQLKLVALDATVLQNVRKQVETVGFATRSVADTVKQIDRLFGTARILLGILGFVALSIAALGMFNTLTVSLLERTREVGLMKAMGMRSNEVRELFLTESLMMGFFGGVIGITLGSLGGVLLSMLLSALSINKNVGYIDISYLPAPFVTFVFVLSLLVGVFTGVYPARRATKISALDALRYE